MKDTRKTLSVATPGPANPAAIPSNRPEGPKQRNLIWIALAASGTLAASEFLGHLLYPQMGTWPFHAIIVAVTGIVAALAAWVVGRGQGRLAQEIVRLAAAVAQAGEAIVITDVQGAIQYVNPAFTRMTGYSAAEALGQNPRLLKSGQLDPAYYTTLWQTILRGQVWQGELINRRKDGTLYTEEMTIAPVRDSAGAIRNFVAVKRDVTERKRMEEDLAHERNLLRTLIDTIPDRIYAKDREGRLTLANLGAAHLYGAQTPEEALGRTALEAIPGAAGKQYHDEDQEVLSSGQPIFDRESHVILPSGETKWFLTNKVPLRDAQGKVIGLIGVGRDITERKRAEEALLFKTALLEAQSETTLDGILVVDEAEHVVLANRQFGLHFGIPDEVLSTRDDRIRLEYVTDRVEDPDAFLERIKYLYSHPDEKSRDELKFRDGRTFDRYSAPLIDSNGKHWGRIWYFRDITERKRAEEALRASESRLRALVDSLEDVVFEFDAEGTYLNVWASDETLLALPKAQLLGKRVPEIVGAEAAEPLPEAIQRVFASGRSEELEYSLSLKESGRRSFLARISPIRAADGSFRTVCFLSRDITERKRAEEELRKAKEAAEAASRAKSEFLANTSHEIRTPMNGILGMTDLALETELNAEQRDYLETVKTSADTLLTIINDILDFSKVEAGKISLDLIDFNLRASLGETMKSLAPAAHQKGLELMLDVQPEVPEYVRGDPTRLRQIVVNLIGNALKFTVQGEIMLRVDIESEAGGQVVLHFAVRDTGMGIPPEKRQVIFEAFAQADASMTRRFGGTGLGLTISAALAKLMAGRIWVESEVGRGSTFHFTARLGKAQPPKSVLPSREPVELRGVPALVVDDNATNRRLLQKWLEAWGMEPGLASDAQTAMQRLRQARAAGRAFPIVLTDAQMPDVDGFVLAERIKADPELAGSIIMMLSSGGQRGDAARCKALGIAGYLGKPIRQSELREAVIRVLETGAEAREAPPLVTRHTLREEHRGSRALLVEDNPVNQLLALRLLEKKGYQVVPAANGREALAALDEQSFQFALVDIQMPDMDGLELTKIIRTKEQASGRHLPLIALTAHALKEDRQACLAAGMDGYVSKPISARELFEVIDSTLAVCSTNCSHEPGATKVPEIVW